MDIIEKVANYDVSEENCGNVIVERMFDSNINVAGQLEHIANGYVKGDDSFKEAVDMVLIALLDVDLEELCKEAANYDK